MNELTDQRFWDNIWKETADLSKYDNEKWVFRNYSFRHFHQICQRILKYDPEKDFLDVGCGVGDWSVYFHRIYGYKLSALDFSPLAIKQAKRNFERQKISANVRAEDFFDHEGHYDVIYAGGFLEHFKNPEIVLSKMYSLLKPGGVVINWIPTLQGRTGWVLRRMDPSVFDTHNILLDQELTDWHKHVGFERTDIYYNGSMSLGMLPISRINKLCGFILRVLTKIANYVCLGLSKLCLCPENRGLSPYKIIVAFKPEG